MITDRASREFIVIYKLWVVFVIFEHLWSFMTPPFLCFAYWIWIELLLLRVIFVSNNQMTLIFLN